MESFCFPFFVPSLLSFDKSKYFIGRDSVYFAIFADIAFSDNHMRRKKKSKLLCILYIWFSKLCKLMSNYKKICFALGFNARKIPQKHKIFKFSF